MPISGKEKFLKYVEVMEVGLFFTCVVWHRCLCRIPFVIFDQNIYNLEISPLLCIKSFASSTYICKTCSKKCQKCEIPCQSVSNKLEVSDSQVCESLKEF